MAFVQKTTKSTELNDPFLKDEGVFHLGVLSADEAPTDRDGQPVDGFKIQFQVLAGKLKGKIHTETFWNEKSTDRDDSATVKQTRILEILGVLDHSKMGQEQEIELVKCEGDEVEQILQGRQVIAKLAKNKSGYLNIDKANFWHIDDPNAEKCERNDAQIARLPKEIRRDPASFPVKEKTETTTTGKSNGKTANGKAPPQRKVDVSNLGSANAGSASTTQTQSSTAVADADDDEIP